MRHHKNEGKYTYEGKYSYIGKYYHDFLEQTVPRYVYISGQDGFNMSCCPINDKEEIYCIRLVGVLPAYFQEEIIPGNYSGTTNIKILEDVPSIGRNFFWNHWLSRGTNDSTIFFVGSFYDGKLIINEKILPVYFQNRPIFSNKSTANNISESTSTMTMGDIRLFRSGNRIYYYDGNVSIIQQIIIDQNEIILYDPMKLYYQTFLCNKDEPGYYYKMYDKNWSFIEYNMVGKYYSFLYWFEETGVSMINVSSIRNNGCIKSTIIEYQQDKILGLGSEKLPMFSFGSTTIRIKPSPLSDYDIIGVGHTKIMRKFKYNEQYKIHLFAKSLNTDLFNIFGKKYIQHNSYHYLMYFFRLMKKGKKYGMLISDSFLPINLDETDKYKFSIVFPMSIFQKNNMLHITCGEGDYYNIILSFDMSFIEQHCIHNVRHFDASKYNYHYLCYQNNTYTIVDDLKSYF